MTASATDIVAHLGQIPLSERVNCNWGLHEDSTFWEVDDDTYINGIVMTIDFDYDISSLLEIVEKSSGVVSYLVVVEFPGFSRDWDAEWYPNPVGTFFDRTVDRFEVCAWAVEKIHGLHQSWYDGKKAILERVENVGIQKD